MPTYEYKREDGSVFEITQSIKDEALKTCPDTGQPVKRIISGGGGVVYKGTGWYVTDYKNNRSERSPEQASAESPEPAPKSVPESKSPAE